MSPSLHQKAVCGKSEIDPSVLGCSSGSDTVQNKPISDAVVPRTPKLGQPCQKCNLGTPNNIPVTLQPLSNVNVSTNEI